MITSLAVVAHVVLVVSFGLRALVRPNRQPSARAGWLLVLISFPVAGIVAYILFGETNIGSRRIARYDAVTPRVHKAAPELPSADTENTHLFRLGHSISGFNPVAGNTAKLLADSDAAIDAMIDDIDAARHHVHLVFYIWLTDDNGTRVIEALIRAAKRGVTARVMADDLGSRTLIKSPHWSRMHASGVKVARALPVDFTLLHPIRGRVDLRNHRKIVVIDGSITYVGSQNCADPEFRPKAKFAPWVDIMVRFEGPIALQNQQLFAEDWTVHTDEDLTDLLQQTPPEAATPGLIAQAIGTGPTVRPSAMPEMFEVLIHAARRDLTITTPYYVPSESMQSAICSAAARGVEVTLILPARNDSRVVASASRSYYPELLRAGVRIFEYHGGLLHTKSMTVDGSLSLIGSANLDRRSFDLNYENNILIENAEFTTDIRNRQRSYLETASAVEPAHVARWGLLRRARYNAVAMMGPVL